MHTTRVDTSDYVVEATRVAPDTDFARYSAYLKDGYRISGVAGHLKMKVIFAIVKLHTKSDFVLRPHICVFQNT